jgi:hypothetical protein
MCGSYIRTIGQSGQIKLTISTNQTDPVTITLTAQV